MLFSRFREGGGSDFDALCRFASAVAQGRCPEPIAGPQRRAAAVAALYLESFGPELADELRETGRLLDRVVQACSGCPEDDRGPAVASAVRRAAPLKRLRSPQSLAA